jgi:hypothetical protein
MTKNGINELYFVTAKNDGSEKVNQDLTDFEADGWQLVCLLTCSEETFYKIRMKDTYNKHMLYLDLYHQGAICETEDGALVKSELLVTNTAKALVVIARKIMKNDYDVEIPELVHSYLLHYDRENPKDFEEFVLS